MRLSLFVLWAIVGWCGNEPLVWLVLRRWWWPIPPTPPPPGPDPWPIVFLLRIIGIVGGIVGGWVFTVAFGFPVPWITAGPHPEPWIPIVVAAATTVGAFLGARLFVDIYALVMRNRNVPRGQ
jgi:hypothetical protein